MPTQENAKENLAQSHYANTVPSKPCTLHAAPQQRIILLDAIRGVALLGIFFMNIYFMGITFFGYAGHDTPLILDEIIETLQNLFIEGRFISLFSLLFGIGIYLQYQKFKLEGQNATSLIHARLRWLIVFGLIHGILIWPGDILLTYGVSGFLALRYSGNSIASLKLRAGLFIFIGLVFVALITLNGDDVVFTRESPVFASQYSAWTASYANQLKLHLLQIGYMVMIIPFTLMWFSAGLMLLGIALYQEGHFERGFSRRSLLQLLLLTLVLSSLDTVFGFSHNSTLEAIADVLVMLSAIPMALIYVHILVKFCQNPSPFVDALQRVGKLAFSLYILQSIVGVLVFRYLAPELLLTLDRWGYFGLALSYSLVQLLIATLYFRWFNQGPLEKLWRYLAFNSGHTDITK
ncbi:DUF418 domain-containing protein [Shewanella sp. A25]|nr:DUF418 domain-containing protein [Shewanella shenzhenensis]